MSQYYAPINAKKCGGKVNLSQTSAYSAMPKQYNPLMAAFG